MNLWMPGGHHWDPEACNEKSSEAELKNQRSWWQVLRVVWGSRMQSTSKQVIYPSFHPFLSFPSFFPTCSRSQPIFNEIQSFLMQWNCLGSIGLSCLAEAVKGSGLAAWLDQRATPKKRVIRANRQPLLVTETYCLPSCCISYIFLWL